LKESKEIKLCNTEDIPLDGKGITITIEDDTQIALFSIKGELFAFDNTCPHNHTHQLHEGTVNNKLMLECPLHGWKFNLITGINPKQKAKLNIFKVKLKENGVYIMFKPTDKFSFKWD
jgi:nitrite reductase/ring-hydroxylating ferredoxin subunit